MEFSEKAVKSGAYRYVINEESKECAVVVDTLPEGEFVIPERVIIKKEEYTVVGIQGKSKNSKITSCHIPSTVKYLLDNCFHGCSGLTEIKLPDSVELISFGSFCDCTSLVFVDLGKSVKKIPHFAFENCPKLEMVATVALEVDFDAFWHCPNAKYSTQEIVKKAKDEKRKEQMFNDALKYRFFFEYDYQGDEGEALHEPGQCLWITETGELRYSIATPEELTDDFEESGVVVTGDDFINADCRDQIDFAIVLAKKFGVDAISDVRLKIYKEGRWDNSVILLSRELRWKKTLCDVDN